MGGESSPGHERRLAFVALELTRFMHFLVVVDRYSSSSKDSYHTILVFTQRSSPLDAIYVALNGIVYE